MVEIILDRQTEFFWLPLYCQIRNISNNCCDYGCSSDRMVVLGVCLFYEKDGNLHLSEKPNINEEDIPGTPKEGCEMFSVSPRQKVVCWVEVNYSCEPHHEYGDVRVVPEETPEEEVSSYEYNYPKEWLYKELYDTFREFSVTWGGDFSYYVY